MNFELNFDETTFYNFLNIFIQARALNLQCDIIKKQEERNKKHSILKSFNSFNHLIFQFKK
ncbi:MAG: hypothetical protein CFE24_13060 [Flavobacterium sp. BFFFF2]|nr:MAG: hypothetical protein CFE24_13060 [Flavobacterium sp. BFFFF2]